MSFRVILWRNQKNANSIMPNMKNVKKYVRAPPHTFSQFPQNTSSVRMSFEGRRLFLQKSASEPGIRPIASLHPHEATIATPRRSTCLRSSLTARNAPSQRHDRYPKTGLVGDDTTPVLRRLQFVKSISEPAFQSKALLPIRPILRQGGSLRRVTQPLSYETSNLLPRQKTVKFFTDDGIVGGRKQAYGLRIQQLTLEDIDVGIWAPLLVPKKDNTEKKCKRQKRVLTLAALEHRIAKIKRQLNDESFEVELGSLVHQTFVLKADVLKDKILKQYLLHRSCQGMEGSVRDFQQVIWKFTSKIKVLRKSLTFYETESAHFTSVLIKCKQILLHQQQRLEMQQPLAATRSPRIPSIPHLFGRQQNGRKTHLSHSNKP
jgi:hypothetical protein